MILGLYIINISSSLLLDTVACETPSFLHLSSLRISPLVAASHSCEANTLLLFMIVAYLHLRLHLSFDQPSDDFLDWLPKCAGFPVPHVAEDTPPPLTLPEGIALIFLSTDPFFFFFSLLQNLFLPPLPVCFSFLLCFFFFLLFPYSFLFPFPVPPFINASSSSFTSSPPCVFLFFFLHLFTFCSSYFSSPLLSAPSSIPFYYLCATLCFSYILSFSLSFFSSSICHSSYFTFPLFLLLVFL